MSYTLDWAQVHLDGDNTLTDGSDHIGVRISTPVSGASHPSEWELGNSIIGDKPTVQSADVGDPTEISLQFDREITDLHFELYDVDSGRNWDDKVTILAVNADGDEVHVAFSDLEDTHLVTGNTIEGEGNALRSIDGPGADDTVTVKIAGPIIGIRIIHDHGDSDDQSGTVGMSDWTFHAGPERDGIVSGTDGDDVIVVDDYVDRDGDEIDNEDAILFNDKPNDDRVEAGAGDDFVDAGDQDDTIDGGTGSDTLKGGSGNDTIYGNDKGQEGIIDDDGFPSPAPDPFPEDDRDSLVGGAGDDKLFGQDDRDTLVGGSGDDTLDGGIDDDEIIGGSGSDSVDGGQGDDLIDAGLRGPDDRPDRGYPPVEDDEDPFNDRDRVDGGLGDDTISTGDDNDTIDGGDGDDRIDAGFDDDRVTGGAGDDRIIAGEGSDTVSGGRGNDTIFGGIGSPGDPINIPDDGSGPFGPDLVTDNGRDWLAGGAGDDIIFGEDDDDTLLGGEGEDLLDAGIDDDRAEGGAGTDLILGRQGDDTLIGGDGADIVLGGDGDDETWGDLGTGDGNAPGGARDLLFGGAGDDTMVGGSGDDSLVGGSGADVQFGGDDRDFFVEVGVGDTVTGGEGGDDFDTMVIGAPAIVFAEDGDPEAGDVVYYDLDDLSIVGTSEFSEIERITFVEDLPNPTPPADGTPPVTSARAPLPGPPQGGDGYVDGTDDNDLIDLDYDEDPEGDFIDNFDAILPGEAPNDDIVLAGDGNDTVEAGLGDDEVFGGDGNDIIDGESGNDVLRGEDGNDEISGGTGSDRLSGEDGNDTLEGDEGRDTLQGGEGNDEMSGGTGNDFLTGGEGNDLLDGGTGSDLLVGGEGNDTFQLSDDDVPDLAFGQDDADTFLGGGAGDTIIGGAGGDDQDEIVTTGFGDQGTDWRLVDVVTDSDGNGIDGKVEFLDDDGDVTGTLVFENIEIICFTPGTRIATPDGLKPVETLNAGDHVLTRDNGVQEIRWYGQTGLNAADFKARPHLAPVLIRRGALGNGLPERDMMVSPQHRVLIASDRAALYFDDREVLVAAKHLVNGTSIVRRPVPQTTYIHFMCARHEVVLSDGAWTESFQPGDFSLNGIDAAQRQEIVELFPELATDAGLEDFGAARRSLKRHEAVLLTR